MARHLQSAAVFINHPNHARVTLAANYSFRGKVSDRNKIVGGPLRAGFDKMPHIPSASSSELNHNNANGITGAV
jgi:hypothetical protein